MEDELIRHVYQSEIGAVNVVRFTQDGNYCLIGGDDKTIRLFNPHKSMNVIQKTNSSETLQRHEKEKDSALFIKAYSGVHGYSILDLSIAQDKTKFVSAGEDRTFYVWDVTSGNVIRRIQGHTQKINSVVLNKDTTVVITASYDQSVRCWDLRSNNRDPIQVLSDFKDSVTSLSLTDSAIVAGSVDGYVRTYDMRMGVLQQDNLVNSVTSVRLSDDQQTYLAASLGSNTSNFNSRGALYLVDSKSGKLLKQFTGHTHTGLKIEASFENDQKHILCGDEAGATVHWNILSGKEISRTIPNSRYSKGYSSLSYHPSLPLYLTSSYDGSVRIWSSGVAQSTESHLGCTKDGIICTGSYQKRSASSFFDKR